MVAATVRSPFRTPEETPIRSALAWHAEAELVVEERFAPGLDGLGGFDFALLVTWLARPEDAAGPPARSVVPFLLQREGRHVGVFATRFPRRPNPLGLHLMRVLEVRGRVVRFAGVDPVDGTPVVDVKPWAPAVDLPPGATPPSAVRAGWCDAVRPEPGAVKKTVAAVGAVLYPHPPCLRQPVPRRCP